MPTKQYVRKANASYSRQDRAGGGTIAYRVDRAEQHVEPTDGRNSLVREKPSVRREPDVGPKKSQERSHLLVHVAHGPVPPQHLPISAEVAVELPGTGTVITSPPKRRKQRSSLAHARAVSSLSTPYYLALHVRNEDIRHLITPLPSCHRILVQHKARAASRAGDFGNAADSGGHYGREAIFIREWSPTATYLLSLGELSSTRKDPDRRLATTTNIIGDFQASFEPNSTLAP